MTPTTVSFWNLPPYLVARKVFFWIETVKCGVKKGGGVSQMNSSFQKYLLEQTRIVNLFLSKFSCLLV